MKVPRIVVVAGSIALVALALVALASVRALRAPAGAVPGSA